MLWMSREKLYHLNRETRMKGKREAFVEAFEKVKLVLVNIKSKLDISMPIMVTNPSIGFGVTPCESFLLTLQRGFLYLVLSCGLDMCHFLYEWWWLKDLTCGLILFVDFPSLIHQQLEINLITNIWSWSIRRLWMHHKILKSTIPL